MSVIDNAKVAIVGAGAVGSSMAYACLTRRSARSVVLYDVNESKVEAEVLDLAHGALYTGASQISGGADPTAIEGAHVVVITAGAKQSPGQTRLELAATNVRILESMLPELQRHAPDAVYVLVTNPCDVLTYAAHGISGLPESRVLSTGTMLDTSRLRMLLSRRAGVAPASVHANIVGEHGDSEFALWSQARIGPVPILEWRGRHESAFSEAELAEITDEVRNAAYRVIQGKGATNYAIGLSGARLVEAILHDENAILQVSRVQSGAHGVNDVALSMPTVVNSGGAVEVFELALTDEETAQLHRSAEALRSARSSLGM